MAEEPSKAAPGVQTVPGKIRVTGKGKKDEQIRIVVKSEANQVVFDQTSTLPDTETHTVEIPVANGKYQVRVEAKIGGAADTVLYDHEVIVG